MGKAVAMAAKGIAACSMELGDAPSASDAVHHAGADEIGPRTAEPARNADDADGLFHVLPLAASDAHAIGKVETAGSGA
jgi:hypothetical protein